MYQKRTGEYVDGCAIFYKREGFSLVEWKGLQYQHNTGTLSRDNVGIVAKFSMQSQRLVSFSLLKKSQYVLLSNSQLLWPVPGYCITTLSSTTRKALL